MKNSFHRVSTIKFTCKLLNACPPQTPKVNEITPLVPFSTDTGDFAQNHLVMSVIGIYRQQFTVPLREELNSARFEVIHRACNLDAAGGFEIP